MNPGQILNLLCAIVCDRQEAVLDPIFWLGLSILLVAVSLTALLVVAIPAFQELGRAARSAEKLFDTLHRELPPTLEAIRLTGLEITELTDDMSEGVQSAGQVVKQMDQSITEVKQQVQKAGTTTRSVFAGVKAAWQTLTQPTRSKSRRIESLREAPSDRSSARNAFPSGEPRSTQVESVDYHYREEIFENGSHLKVELEHSLAELESELELHHAQLEEMNRITPPASETKGASNNPSGNLPQNRQPVHREPE